MKGLGMHHTQYVSLNLAPLLQGLRKCRPLTPKRALVISRIQRWWKMFCTHFRWFRLKSDRSPDSLSFYQFVDVHLQSNRKFQKSWQHKVLTCIFNPANLSSFHITPVCKVLLREPFLKPDSSQVVADYLIMFFMLFLHQMKKSKCIDQENYIVSVLTQIQLLLSLIPVSVLTQVCCNNF